MKWSRPRGRPLDGGEGTRTAEMTDATREATQRVWWYLLFAAAIFLAAETMCRIDGDENGCHLLAISYQLSALRKRLALIRQFMAFRFVFL